MKIALCEDHGGDAALLRRLVQDYFKRIGYAGTIYTYSSAEDLLRAFSPGAFDIIMLDIYLPGMSGIDAARKIRESDSAVLLLFTTVSMDHALDGFDVGASGYVVKPFDQQKVDKALFMCRSALEKAARTIEVPSSGKGALKLPLTNLQFVEVMGRDSLFHLTSGVIEAKITLDDVESLLDGIPFMRCHRSYIVNMNYIRAVDPDEFVMDCGERVPIRKNGRKTLKLDFTQYKAGSLPEGPTHET